MRNGKTHLKEQQLTPASKFRPKQKKKIALRSELR